MCERVRVSKNAYKYVREREREREREEGKRPRKKTNSWLFSHRREKSFNGRPPPAEHVVAQAPLSGSGTFPEWKLPQIKLNWFHLISLPEKIFFRQKTLFSDTFH